VSSRPGGSGGAGMRRCLLSLSAHVDWCGLATEAPGRYLEGSSSPPSVLGLLLRTAASVSGPSGQAAGYPDPGEVLGSNAGDSGGDGCEWGVETIGLTAYAFDVR